MAASIQIPTTFTANDKFTRVVSKMTQGVKKFSKNSVAAVKRLDHRINNSFRRIGKLGALIGGLTLGTLFNSAIQNNIAYDKSIQSIQAVTGKSGKEFDKYRDKILALGNAQKMLYGDVAKSMEIVGSAQPELLENATNLSKVTDAALTLAKAGNLSQEDAALALTAVMNQYGAGADEAKKYIDILATSEKKGSSIIRNTADALVVAGGTAAAFNLTFEDSNAFIQAFAKGGKLGSEAGTQFAGVLSKLSKVQDKRFNPAFTNAFDVMQNLKDANLSYTDLLKMTDSQGAKWITTLLNQNETLQKLRGNLNDVNAAQDAAATKTNTLDFYIKSIKTSFLNYTTATDDSSKSTQLLKDALKFIADNIDKVVIGITALIGLFVAWKAIVVIATIATGAWTAAQWLLNVALTANQIGIIIVAIGALIGLVIWAIAKYDEWGAALLMFMGPIGMIINLFQSFRRHWDSIVQAFKTGGILGALKRIGAVILDALLYPMQQLLNLIAKIPGMGGLAGSLNDKIDGMRERLGVKEDERLGVKEDETLGVKEDETLPSTTQVSNENVSKSITENNSNVRLDIVDKGGNVGGVQNDSGIPINLGPTAAAF